MNRKNSIRYKHIVLITVLSALATGTLALAQQSDKHGLIAYAGPSDLWNLPWINGTRTDLAPKPEVSTEGEHKCVPSQSEVEAVERAWGLQNSETSVLTAVANALALKTARENWERRCSSLGNKKTFERRSRIGLPEPKHEGGSSADDH